MIDALALLKAWWWQILVAMAIIYAAIASVGAIHAYGDRREQAGRDAVLASDARAAQQLQAQHAALEHFSALAGTALQQNLGKQLPAIEATTHDTQETIRVIYRDRPVPADPVAACSRPGSVQQALDAAVQRANAAADGHL